MRRGIFGGSFNPPHMGHLKSLESIIKKTGLDAIHVIPANENPHKLQTEGPTPEQRLKMINLALQGYSNKLIVDDREIKRGGVSYTIDTLQSFKNEFPKDQIFLIIGYDQFENFHSWKEFTKIIESTNLIVTSRPGFDLPSSEDELPEFIKPYIEDYDFNVAELKNDISLQFLEIEDVEVSSSELRKLIRTNQKVDQFIPLSVESYIRENKIYASVSNKITDYKKFTRFCADQVSDGKGIDVRAYDLTECSAPSEFTVIASGTSTRHTDALASNLVRKVKQEFHLYPQSVEGLEEGRWVIVDYGQLMVHIFYDFVRGEYSLESLWKEGKLIPESK